METKVQNIKSARKKNSGGRAFSEKVADICGCNTRYVQYILSKSRTPRSELAEKIVLAALLLEAKEEKAIEEIKELVNASKAA